LDRLPVLVVVFVVDPAIIPHPIVASSVMSAAGNAWTMVEHDPRAFAAGPHGTPSSQMTYGGVTIPGCVPRDLATTTRSDFFIDGVHAKARWATISLGN
jgi:hypothetical protein